MGTARGLRAVVPPALRRRVAAWQRVRRRRAVGPNRYTARSREDAREVLVAVASHWAQRRPGPVVVLADPGRPDEADVAAELGARHDTRVVEAPTDGAALVDAVLAGGEPSCIVLATGSSRRQFELAGVLVHDDRTADIPLEYVATPRVENAAIDQWDKYTATDFVSPLLVRHGDAFLRIYREVLGRFRLKMDVRDYLDLCQLLESVVVRQVAGDVAEFGSYRGHSGFLISRVLEHLGSDKRLWMFDMFESFPEEGIGIDGFWSQTHEVDFDEVRGKFEGRPAVELVKGDFTRTLESSAVDRLALAFVDCDSYRATQYLLPRLWDHHVVVGGIVVLEDYGHAALLGNRLAVHEFFDGRADAVTWFSAYSGFFVALKVA